MQRVFSHSLVLELFLEASAMSKDEEVSQIWSHFKDDRMQRCFLPLLLNTKFQLIFSK